MSLIEKLLEELNNSGAISVSIAGPVKDSATVALPTFLGGLVGGPAGAVLGSSLLILKYHCFNIVQVCLLKERLLEQEFLVYQRLWDMAITNLL